jgi:YD repeat-containing protein
MARKARVEFVGHTMSYTYTAPNQVLTIDDSGQTGTTVSYSYDASGNRLSRASTTGKNAYFYYDGLNRQVARSITGEPVYFSVWDDRI